MHRTLVLLAALGALVFASSAAASTLTLSDEVSKQPNILDGDAFTCGTPGHDPCITADMLDATLDFAVSGTELTITLTNNTSPTFDISEIYFSAETNVTGLTLTSVDGDMQGDVLTKWSIFASTGNGGPTHGDGMGVHDYSLKTGSGQNFAGALPGEEMVFVFDISGTGPYDMTDFVVLSEQTGPSGDNVLTFATLKFVMGDPNIFQYEDNDSAFGGGTTPPPGMPEPGTAGLMALGVLGLAAWRSRAR